MPAPADASEIAGLARQAYEAVIKGFPDSNAAVFAKQRLEALPR